MSKLLALLTQQKALEAQIKELEANEQEAKVLEAVKEIEAVREKFNYNESDFVDVLLTYYNVNATPAAKPAKRAYTKKAAGTATTKAETFNVQVGKDTVPIRRSTNGRLSGELKRAVEAGGFERYDQFLADLMAKNKVESFDDLIKKIGV